VLFYSFLHYAARPWPWIIVGLGSLIYFPDLADPETAYPLMMIKFLPNGLRGMLVAGFLAAFMSTVSTHINLGASYMVSDLYKRFLVKDASEKHYVWVSRAAILVMTALAGLACLLMKSVYSAWLLASALMAGPALIVLLRWYWWRINAWSEIAALLSALVLALTLANSSFLAGDDHYAFRLLLMIGVCTAVALAATFLTKPEPVEHLEKFFRRVRPGGWWGPIAAKCPDVRRMKAGREEFLSWGLTVVSIYLALFGLGWIVMGRFAQGLLGFGLALILIRVILKRIDRMEWA
jgi:Na+/proline symporter